MKYVILKQLLPEMTDIPEELQYIEWCTCIEGDEKFEFDTLSEAEVKIEEIKNDNRYIGRKLKIKGVE